MSRFRDWNNAWSGIEKYLTSQGFVLDIRNVKNKKNRYVVIEIRNIVKKYSKYKKLNGSITDKYIEISNDFNSFKQWISEQDFSYYKE